MTRDDDFTLLLRDYLDEFEGSTPLPDDARNAIRAELPSIRQRPAWWPGWRLPTMNPAMRITLATAAVVAVALLGLGYLRSQNTGDPGLDDPTSTAVPLAFPVDGFESLGPGRYVAADPFPARLTLDVPAGWDGNIGGPYAVWLEKPNVSEWVEFVVFDEVAVDPCQSQDFVTAGPSVDDLATALAGVSSLQVTEVSEISVDGYRGTQLLMAAPDTLAECTVGQDGYVVWRLPLGAQHSMGNGERHRVWILDVDGQRIVISFPEPPQVTDEQMAEIQGIVDSLAIEAGG